MDLYIFMHSMCPVAGGGSEYCELETFRPVCLSNEVILIVTAIYGRRYVNRCLAKENFDFTANPSFLGCSADVMEYVGQKCSGKRRCEISIPDANLQNTQPCPVGLDMFLEVEYSCLEGKLKLVSRNILTNLLWTFYSLRTTDYGNQYFQKSFRI